MKPLILAILLRLVALAHPQEKRDLMEIESTDGKKSNVQLLSATFSQVQFKRLDSDKTFELSLNKLSESTVKAIRAWTIEYNKRTPIGFRQFSLGMPLKTLETLATEGKISVFNKIKTGQDASMEFQLTRGFQEDWQDYKILATTETKLGPKHFFMDRILATFKNGKLTTLLVKGPVAPKDETVDWLLTMKDVLNEKYGAPQTNNNKVFWPYNQDMVVAIFASEPDGLFKTRGQMLFAERSTLDAFAGKTDESSPKTKGKF